jgi:Circularly permutated YpsA SLOG family
MAGIEKLISGAQSGADRAALDFAIDHRIPHGGWCPLGRKAEDGTIDPRYNLQETPSSGYVQRTEWNARDSDGTVVFSIAPVLTGGSKKTVELAHKHRKPVIHIARDGGSGLPAQALLRFVQDNKIKVLNIEGPRASKEREVYDFARATLEAAWEQANDFGQ